MNRLLPSVPALALNLTLPTLTFSTPSPAPFTLSTPSFTPFLSLFLLLLLPLLYLLYAHHGTPLSHIALRALRHGPIPSHIAFIMDGNRRWARRLSLPAFRGHPRGGERLIDTLEWCLEAGVSVVTVYAFSIENFKRPQEEVSAIFELAEHNFHKLSQQSAIIHQRKVRVRVIGDLSTLPPSLRTIMATVMRDTRHYNGPILNVAFAYTARNDIATAIAELSDQVRAGYIQPCDITAEAVQSCLSTAELKGGKNPCPELLVRTSGETRLSDFLLWEAQQSVLQFCPVLWPDFSPWHFVSILMRYQKVVRRLRTADGPCGVRETPRDDEQSKLSQALGHIRKQYFQTIDGYC